MAVILVDRHDLGRLQRTGGPLAPLPTVAIDNTKGYTTQIAHLEEKVEEQLAVILEICCPVHYVPSYSISILHI